MKLETKDNLFKNATLTGPNTNRSKKLLSQLSGIFKDSEAYDKMDGEQIIYEVDSLMPVEGGTEGALFFGITHLNPGTVGDEYFMTHGHFHEIENRGEYYWGIEGEGQLILMDKDRNVWTQDMFPGSLHYIPGFTGHRVANTGDSTLRFGACWPSDAGHKYDVILKEGFTKRLCKVNGKPCLIN